MKGNRAKLSFRFLKNCFQRVQREVHRHTTALVSPSVVSFGVTFHYVSETCWRRRNSLKLNRILSQPESQFCKNHPFNVCQ